jgi:hypothetical protein
MALAILQHTPLWVFAVLAALIAMGLSQAFAREATLLRVTVLPVVMLGLSLQGVDANFGHNAAALLAWAAGVAVAVLALQGRVDTSRVRYSAAGRRFSLPGSWVPLALMLVIFSVKFGLGVSLAMHPALTASTALALTASAAYGVFSGLFLGRAMALWALARRGASALAA